MPQYLTVDTAKQFPADTSDGFARPMLAWSAFGPQHLDGVLSSSMTSNVWYGKPNTMLDFIEKLAAHYESLKSNIELDDEMDGISLGYWEKDGVAMIAEFCTGDAFYEQKSDDLDEKAQDLQLLLGDGNDNNAGMILANESEMQLDVPTRLTLANFMTLSAKWVLDEAAYTDSNLEGFTADDKIQLLLTLQEEGSSQTTAAPHPDFDGKTFVVTGTMKNMDRHTIELAIIRLGGNVASNISKKTFAMIAGPDASPSKLTKATTLGKAVWDEETFVATAGLHIQTSQPKSES